MQIRCGSRQVFRESALDVNHTGTKGDLLGRDTRDFESRDIDKPSDALVFGFDWFTLNRVQFASKYTCRLLLRVGSLATRRQEKLHTLIK